MPTQFETAYRHLRPDISENDLKRLYTPTPAEREFIASITERPWANLALTIHYKAFRYLGYFVTLKNVPERIKVHIAKCLGFPRLPPEHRLEGYDQGRHRRAHFDRIREKLGVRPFSPSKQKGWIETTARQAAQTKHNVPDIINQLIEELVRQKFELPGFSTLESIAVQARTDVHDAYLSKVASGLTPEAKATIDGLLKRGTSLLTGWNSLKREPRKPGNKEVRFWLQHIERLKRLSDQMPPLDIPMPKLRFFRDWARAYDATQLSRLKAPTRYGLAAIYIHFQRGQALDDAVELYIRFIQKLENLAIRKLQEHRLSTGETADELIAQLRTTAVAAQTQGSKETRLRAIDASFDQDLTSVVEACDQHLAVRHKDFLPFLLTPSESTRRLLLNCLEIAELHALDDESESRQLLAVLKNLRGMRKKRELTYADVGLVPTDLSWLSELWRRHVLVSSPSGETLLDRSYLELAILFRIRAELKSGELYVPKGERFDDYREHLVDDKRFKEELVAYGETTKIEVDPKRHVDELRKSLAATTLRVDTRFPTNAYATIEDGKLSLKRSRRDEPNPETAKLEALISERMAQINIADVITDTCRWVNLAAEFRTVSGETSRVKELFLRVVTTIVCYGLNFGPVQTARSVKTVSRKQVSWINLQYVTEPLLDRVIMKVVNRFNEYRLPQYWGSGKSASADGTKWSLYEQNLISERHIRYGGYGGIGYYHVSDRYIALMSHFTTCGTHEAIFILDGLLNNNSDIQPDTVHGDTQAQSLPVFALAHLLGIKLMPRIRNMKDLAFSRAEAKHRCKNIEALFRDNIDWDLIEKHLPEMMRIAVSIKLGLITSSSILRRLGTHNRKNPIYFAFRELGKVVRTKFMLEYLDDVEIRKTIQAATNKSEQFNRFVKLIFFGGEGIIAENVRHEQRKMVKYAHLAANLVILHNVNQMTRILRELEMEGVTLTAETLAGISPFRVGHLDRLGNYVVDVDRPAEESLQHWQFTIPAPDAPSTDEQRRH